MDFVLTLIASPKARGLHTRHADRARRAIFRVGGESRVGEWLAHHAAIDIEFNGPLPHIARAAVAEELKSEPFDIIAQPREGRRKVLLLADMDSTIVTSETLDDLAAFAGVKDAVAAITARAMNGELDFAASLQARVAMLKGLSEERLKEAWDHVRLTPGAKSLVKTMRANGAHCVLVSGGFTFFTGRVAERCGFHEHRANRFAFADGKLTGEVERPIVDRDAKLRTLLELSKSKEIALEQALTVGDGANDVPMLKAAGLGIAFHAKDIVRREVHAQVNHGDLTALLYAQGYHRDEFLG